MTVILSDITAYCHVSLRDSAEAYLWLVPSRWTGSEGTPALWFGEGYPENKPIYSTALLWRTECEFEFCIVWHMVSARIIGLIHQHSVFYIWKSKVIGVVSLVITDDHLNLRVYEEQTTVQNLEESFIKVYAPWKVLAVTSPKNKYHCVSQRQLLHTLTIFQNTRCKV